jgi:hypothetical protein
MEYRPFPRRQRGERDLIALNGGLSVRVELADHLPSTFTGRKFKNDRILMRIFETVLNDQRFIGFVTSSQWMNMPKRSLFNQWLSSTGIIFRLNSRRYRE